MIFPYEIRISPKVRAVVGHPDNHVDIYVTVNLLITTKEIPLRLEAEDMGAIEKVVAIQKKWLAQNK